jgi:hypothetical protein
VATGVAQEAVRTRLQSHNLPGPVLEFLVEHWLKLLLIVHVKRGPDSEPWKIALEAMDQLIWSVQPKATLQERRQLASAVPALLRRLSAGLQSLGAEDGVRESFFAELMKYHTELLANGKSKAGAGEQSRYQAPEFTGSITVRNPFGAGDVKVDAKALDFTAGASLPSSLRIGVWAELREGDKRQPARLIFISPRKTRCFFVDRTGKNYIEFTREEIVRRLRSGEVTLMDEVPETPLFERIMGSVIGKMRGG